MELREIHHRLKNQLNILVSYISLQLQAGVGEDVRSSLKDVQHRILAISMVHEEIYRSSGVEAPSLDVYLPRLCDYILEDLAGNEIEVEYDIGRFSLPMDKEVSIAIILSELLTNTIKHAFPSGGRMAVSVGVKREADGRIELSYRDNGVGLPAGFAPGAAKSMGMLIVDALVRQLDGTMRAESDCGAVFTFAFRARPAPR
jgi:two-component sensor histidine kinase